MSSSDKTSTTWPKVGSRVRHWYAGTGTVTRIQGACANVQWDRDGRGLAWIKDLGAA